MARRSNYSLTVYGLIKHRFHAELCFRADLLYGFPVLFTNSFFVYLVKLKLPCFKRNTCLDVTEKTQCLFLPLLSLPTPSFTLSCDVGAWNIQVIEDSGF